MSTTNTPAGAPAGLLALLDRLDGLLKAATPRPWAWAQTAEKDYGTNIGAGCFAEDDEDCKRPLAGDLSEREDDYSVDQPIAELGDQYAASNAALIVEAINALPALLTSARRGAETTTTPQDSPHHTGG